MATKQKEESKTAQVPGQFTIDCPVETNELDTTFYVRGRYPTFYHNPKVLVSYVDECDPVNDLPDEEATLANGCWHHEFDRPPTSAASVSAEFQSGGTSIEPPVGPVSFSVATGGQDSCDPCN